MITSPAQLASALKNARHASSLTQRTLAERAGIKQATVSAFENRPEASSLETVFKLLAALDMQLEVSSRGEAASNLGWDEEW